MMRLLKWKRKNGTIKQNVQKTSPHASVYQLSVDLNSGTTLPLQNLKGKKVLLVNTASDCAFTGQYAELQQLYDKFKSRLEIIGFPANDFKEQEKGNDEDIAQFCQINYGVKFPLAKKSIVINNPDQNVVFRWLTHAEQNGWNNTPPKWNFSKYLLDEQGNLTHYFDPSVSPLSKQVADAINLKT
jgi:glutathione peroxidase